MTSYRTHARVLLLLLIGGLLAATLVLSPAGALAQDPTKPDVHFSFIIEKNGSNTTSVEVAVNPLFDPLIKKGIEFVKNSLAKNEEKKDATYKITTTVRDGRDYQAILVPQNCTTS